MIAAAHTECPALVFCQQINWDLYVHEAWYVYVSRILALNCCMHVMGILTWSILDITLERRHRNFTRTIPHKGVRQHNEGRQVSRGTVVLLDRSIISTVDKTIQTHLNVCIALQITLSSSFLYKMSTHISSRELDDAISFTVPLSNYNTDSLCRNYTLRRHSWDAEASAGSHEARLDWIKYVGPTEQFGGPHQWQFLSFSFTAHKA